MLKFSPMKKEIHRADTRGHSDLGWLQSYFSFSFAEYRNPERTRFGLLRVVNDDTIAPGKGFGTHPHDNMEIVTVMLDGALAHKDSMGNEFIIKKGEIQRMSAGTGLTHSEFNASDSESACLLQCWVFTKEKDIPPSYEQKKFDLEARNNRFQLAVSPDGAEGSLSIHQEAYFSLVDLSLPKEYQWHQPGHGVFFFVIEGSAEIAGETLGKRDAIAISDITSVTITPKDSAELLVIEVPMRK